MYVCMYVRITFLIFFHARRCPWMNPISCTRRSPPPPNDLSPNWPLILEGGAGGGAEPIFFGSEPIIEKLSSFVSVDSEFESRDRIESGTQRRTQRRTQFGGGGGRVTSCHWYEAASNELVLYYQVTHGEVTTRQRLKAISWNRRKEVVTPRWLMRDKNLPEFLPNLPDFV